MASASRGPSVMGNVALVFLFLSLFVTLTTVVYVVGTPARNPPPAASLDVVAVERPQPNAVELVLRHRAGETLRAGNVAFVVTTSENRLEWEGGDARHPGHILESGERITVTLTPDGATVQWGTNPASRPVTWPSPSEGAAFVPDGGSTLAVRVYRPPSTTAVTTVETTVPQTEARQTTNSTG